jgi:hypothetical protein
LKSLYELYCRRRRRRAVDRHGESRPRPCRPLQLHPAPPPATRRGRAVRIPEASPGESRSSGGGPALAADADVWCPWNGVGGGGSGAESLVLLSIFSLFKPLGLSNLLPSVQPWFSSSAGVVNTPELGAPRHGTATFRDPVRFEIPVRRQLHSRTVTGASTLTARVIVFAWFAQVQPSEESPRCPWTTAVERRRRLGLRVHSAFANTSSRTSRGLGGSERRRQRRPLLWRRSAASLLWQCRPKRHPPPTRR